MARHRLRLKSTLEMDELEDTEVDTERGRLFGDILKWRQRQAIQMPQLAQHLAEDPLTEHDMRDVEERALWLPSDFDRVSIQEFGLDKPAEIELELRKGEAYGALRELRASISHIAALQTERRKHASGSSGRTRAANVVMTAIKHRDVAAEDYKEARRVIIMLDSSDHIKESFPLLEKGDLTIKSIEKGTDLGKGKVTDSWIWTVGVRSDELTSTWEDDSESIFLTVRDNRRLIAFI